MRLVRLGFRRQGKLHRQAIHQGSIVYVTMPANVSHPDCRAERLYGGEPFTRSALYLC